MCHKTEKIIQEPRYPRFISNRAIGDDKLKGESQNRLASAIQKYVESTDSNLSQENCLPRIIGIEGPWGSGKTNVVRNLKKKLSGSYYVFEYDAWGHQEDLQRRSILETLTSQLIEDGVLPKEDKVTPSIVENDTLVSWPTKLEELLAHRKITDNTTVPMLNGGAIVLLCCSILIPLLRNIVDVYFNCWHSLVKACFPYFPFFLALLGWCMCSLWHKRKINLGELLKISKEGSTTTRNYETISEDEPSVMKFKKWMNDLSDYLVHSSKQNKLILVFDNMDRLQKHQVREFWASIHTFFSEGSFENIWAIIPYDFNHLKDTFDETADAELFLQKTFPVSYSVASPVVSDYKDIFYQFYLIKSR